MNVSSSVSVFNPVQTKAQIHLAIHEGYELSRPSEFFDRYGPYVLGILKILRHCLAVAALVSPGIGQLQDTVDIALNKAEYIAKNTMDAVDMSINFLQQKLEDHAFAESFPTQESDDQRGDPSFKNLTALEGADLRRLDTFLRNKDKDKVLGNLYRITTSEGHVKWVCLEHYRASYRETAMASFLQLVQVNQGVYDAQLRKVTINLSSRTVATEFFRKIAGQAPALNEIDMTINWSFRSADLVTIVTALSQSNVRVLKLDLMDYGRSSRVDLKLPGWGKYYPLMDLLANTKLQGLTIKGTDFFGSRTSELSRRQSSTFLRSFHHLNVINPTDESRLANILRHCPNLAELRLGSFDGESVVHSKLERAIAGLTKLKSLHLYRLDIDTRNDPHAFDDRGCWVIMPYRADSMKELVRTDFIMRHHQLEDAIQQFSTTLEVLMLEHIPEHHCLSLDLAPGHKHDHSGSITTNWSPPPAYSHSQPFSKLTHLHFEIPISKSSIDLLALVLPGLSLIHFGINGHLATLLKKVNFSTLKSLSLSDMDETLLTPFLDTILHAESHSCQINAMHFSGIKNIRRLPDLLKVVSLTQLDIVQAKRAELQAILRSLDLSKLQVLALNCDEFDWSSEEALAGRSGEFAEDLVVKLSPSPLDMKNGTFVCIDACVFIEGAWNVRMDN
ncbi:hypothetical protein BGX23_003887 [Mortierella sp. AD031]|nr:hypothetical protein BGX23_003887 [Mortierella sp. AD031]